MYYVENHWSNIMFSSHSIGKWKNNIMKDREFNMRKWLSFPFSYISYSEWTLQTNAWDWMDEFASKQINLLLYKLLLLNSCAEYVIFGGFARTSYEINYFTNATEKLIWYWQATSCFYNLLSCLSSVCCR